MSDDFYWLAVVSIVVAIDNALLAGLLLPPSRRKRMIQTIVTVGIALSIAQVGLAMGVGSLLRVAPFRLLATGVLIWMSIHTVRNIRFYTRSSQPRFLRVVVGVFCYSALGNLDNMIWLGANLKGHAVWLVFFSIITVPLFVIVGMFLSDQCQRYGWISILGAGMMAWAAASLWLTTPPTQKFAVRMPSLLFHALFTMVVLVAGLAARRARRPI
jgi:predicted tellurium resistance membrane protein TerC